MLFLILRCMFLGLFSIIGKMNAFRQKLATQIREKSATNVPPKLQLLGLFENKTALLVV